MSRSADDERDLRDERSLVRHEEELALESRVVEAGAVRARKEVDSERVSQRHERDVEYFDDVEQVAAQEGDSGEVETLPDGSVSIPIFEERLVVTKQLVVRERVIIRKRTVTEQEQVQTELRKERIEVEGDVDPIEPESS